MAVMRRSPRASAALRSARRWSRRRPTAPTTARMAITAAPLIAATAITAARRTTATLTRHGPRTATAIRVRTTLRPTPTFPALTGRTARRARITSSAPVRASSTRVGIRTERAGLEPAFSFGQSRQPVERALQDEHRGVLIDHRGALGAADVRADQFALDRGGGEPLVPQRNRQVGELFEIARERAGRLRARPFAAVH